MLVNRYEMGETDHLLEEIKIVELNVGKYQALSMTTCIVLSKKGIEAFVVHFKDEILLNGYNQ